MIRGTVTKLVSTFGSQWGRIRVDGVERELFFNTQSLEEPSDFARLQIGQAVEFEAHADQVNGGHAENLTIVSDADPVAVQPEPVAARAEPMAAHAEPVAARAEPRAAHAEPRAPPAAPASSAGISRRPNR